MRSHYYIFNVTLFNFKLHHEVALNRQFFDNIRRIYNLWHQSVSTLNKLGTWYKYYKVFLTTQGLFDMFFTQLSCVGKGLLLGVNFTLVRFFFANHVSCNTKTGILLKSIFSVKICSQYT